MVVVGGRERGLEIYRDGVSTDLKILKRLGRDKS